MADIVAAFGYQVRDWAKHDEIVQFLNDNATADGSSKWTYPQKDPLHTVELVYTKSEFAAALDQKDAIVIYDGHSRIGQGPAFGGPGFKYCPDRADAPINPWGDTFRMGYDFADVDCHGDIMFHGTDPPEYTLPKDAKDVFASKGLKKILADVLKADKAVCSASIGWRELSVCWAKDAAKVTCRSDTPLAKRHYWRHFRRGDGFDFDTLVAVGSADLDNTTLACSVLFMNSCSSKKHYYEALARHKKKVKSSCVFYLTADLCSGQTTLPMIKAVLNGKDPIKDKDYILGRLNRVISSGFVNFVK